MVIKGRFGRRPPRYGWLVVCALFAGLLVGWCFLPGCADHAYYPYPCDHPYATAWRFDLDVGRFCRSICNSAAGAAESSDFDVLATQLPEYDCWPIVRE